MTKRFYRVLVLLIVTLVVILTGWTIGATQAQQGGSSPSASVAPTANAAFAVFRGNPGRTGNYETEGPQQLKTVLWTHDAVGQLVSAPVVSDGTVYIASQGDILLAIDAKTGALRIALDASEYAPAVQNGVVYFGRNGALVALHTDNWQEKWHFNIGKRKISSSPILVDDIVYFTLSDGNVYALGQQTGELKWWAKVADQIATEPAIADGILYVAGSLKPFDPSSHLSARQRNIYALDAKTGAALWTFAPPASIESPGSVRNPVVLGGIVYCASLGDADIGPGYVHALDAKTGKELWKYSPTGGLDYPPPLVATANRLLVLSAYNRLIALDPRTGAEEWQFQGSYSLEDPVISGDTAYLATADGKVLSLNMATGSKLAEFDTGLESARWPVPDNGVLYFAAGLPNKLYALK